MREAELADGTILEFPDETPDAVIQAAVKKLVAPTEKPGFIENTKTDAMKREAQTREIDARQAAGIQSDASSFLQKAGVGAGFMADTVGNAVKSGYDSLPESVTGPVNATAANIAGRALANPYVSGAIQKTGDYVKGLEQRNPAEFNNLAAVLNIGGVMSPSTLVKPTPKGLTGMAGDAIGSMADKQVAKQTKKFTEKLVAPKETPTVKEANVSRTTENMFGTKKTALDPRSAEAAQEVAKVKGVGKGKTLQGNYNVIQQEVRREADKLIDDLDKNDVPLSPTDYNDALYTNVNRRLAEELNLTGDNADIANRVMAKYAQIINSKPRTAANLLRARRELDSWIKSQKGSNAFDPKFDNALSSAVRIIRQESNDLVDRKVGSIDVSGSLKKQKDLLNAMENIAPKAADEANTVIGRFVQNIGKATGIKNKLGQTAALAAGTGVGAAAAAAIPVVTGLAAAGYITYKGGKMVLSPTVKKALAISLKKSDQALRKIQDTDVSQSIKKDRAFVLDLLQNMREDEATK